MPAKMLLPLSGSSVKNKWNNIGHTAFTFNCLSASSVV